MAADAVAGQNKRQDRYPDPLESRHRVAQHLLTEQSILLAPARRPLGELLEQHGRGDKMRTRWNLKNPSTSVDAPSREEHNGGGRDAQLATVRPGSVPSISPHVSRLYPVSHRQLLIIAPLITPHTCL